MERIHSVVTTTMVALLLTSAAVGAVSNGPVADAVGNVAGTGPTADETAPNSTAPDATAANDTTTADANVTRRQVVAALGPFLDGLDASERLEARVLDRAEALAADGAAPARLVDATYHALRAGGVPAGELHESAWRLRVGMVLAQLDLTADQRAAVFETVEAERADDAGWRDVRRAAGTELLDYGVERSEVRTAIRRVEHVELHLRMHRLRHRHRRFHDRARGNHADEDHPDGKSAWAHRVQHRYDLTDEQTREVVELVDRLRAAGEDRPATAAAVHRKLHAFGADHRHGGRFEPHEGS